MAPGTSSGDRDRVVLYGRTTVAKPFHEGSKSVWVASAMELFGPLVEMCKVDGRFELMYAHGVKPQTVQIGGSLAVYVEKVVNNELVVTPISVRESCIQGTYVVHGSAAPGAPKEEHKKGHEVTGIDMDLLRREVANLEDIGAYMKRRPQPGAHGGDVVEQLARGSKNEIEADQAERMGDEKFWEGIAAEKFHNPMRIFNCPLLDFE
ncbi:hypothetical protein T484DRAFT_1764369 [Baffinella frigidus]|nr:hypothetical protein T484DRAFT_1764369 [Cryptophyta sp. CCMP2293]